MLISAIFVLLLWFCVFDIAPLVTGDYWCTLIWIVHVRLSWVHITFGLIDMLFVVSGS